MNTNLQAQAMLHAHEGDKYERLAKATVDNETRHHYLNIAAAHTRLSVHLIHKMETNNDKH